MCEAKRAYVETEAKLAWVETDFSIRILLIPLDWGLRCKIFWRRGYRKGSTIF